MHNCRFKKSRQESKDGTKNTVVREDNVIRIYNTGGSKLSETTYPSNAAARREMATA